MGVDALGEAEGLEDFLEVGERGFFGGEFEFVTGEAVGLDFAEVAGGAGEEGVSGGSGSFEGADGFFGFRVEEGVYA